MFANFREFEQYIEKIKQGFCKKPSVKILVSLGTCGVAAGTLPIYNELINEIKRRNLSDKIDVIETGCMGLCYCEPSIEIIDKVFGKNIIYGNLKKEDVRKIIDFVSGRGVDGIDIIKRSWYYPEVEENIENHYQAKIALRNTGRINPEDVEEYLFNDGYKALIKVLNLMSPENVIKEISLSGLKGRGGGGFFYEQEVGIRCSSKKSGKICDMQCRRRRSRGVYGQSCS